MARDGGRQDGAAGRGRRGGGARRTGLLGLALAVALAPVAERPAFAAATGTGAGATLALPADVGAKRAQVLDALALDLMLERGYEEKKADEGGFRLAGIAGIEGARFFVQAADDRRLELGLTGADEGGWSLRMWGSQGSGATLRPNPDLAWAQDAAKKALRSVRRKGGGNEAYLTYRLSFAQADRALAVLKALGYTTIEFNPPPIGPQMPGLMPVNDPYLEERDKLFQAVRGEGAAPLPMIVRLLDTDKTSLMDPGDSGQGGGGDFSGSSATDLGGTHLHQGTASDQQQRLLIVYDRDFPEDAERVMNLLKTEIDVPARQIVIEALVIEIIERNAKDLGVSFAGSNGKVSFGAFQPVYGKNADGSPAYDNQVGETPYYMTLDTGAARTPFQLQAQISALVASGRAEVVSKPSVLVLDGRQARIQIGQQVPVSKAVAAGQAVATGIEYLTVGIVLNLRPRISDDGQEISMQVETIVSAVNQTATGTITTGESSSVLLAPTLDNRQVQTIVRVADSTPFIIGGLTSSITSKQKEGLAFLSNLPLIGRLFQRNRSDSDRKEVIVVLTPHVVPVDDRNFSFVVPKDSEMFNSFDKQLFRNAYRIENRDVFDLKFIREAQALHDLRADLRAAAELDPAVKQDPEAAAILAGRIPGEDIMVKRMLWELVRKTDFARHVNLDKTIFFASEGTAKDEVLQLSFFGPRLLARTPEKNALILSFAAEDETSEDHPFSRSRASFTYEALAREKVASRLRESNRRGPDGKPLEWTIVLSDHPAGTTHPIDLLKGVLVLKRMLELNPNLPLTIDDFHPGRQVIFPSQDDVALRFHVVDRDSARLFYEVWDNYAAFEAEFNLRTRQLRERLGLRKAGTAN